MTEVTGGAARPQWLKPWFHDPSIAVLLPCFETDFMLQGSSASGSDSKRRPLPVPKGTPDMQTFIPDSSVVSDVVPSANYAERANNRAPDTIVLHYTGMPDAEGALARLCTAGTDVSAHYVVLEDGGVVQCVPEAGRARHAGAS